jgi:hypothetical protein
MRPYMAGFMALGLALSGCTMSGSGYRVQTASPTGITILTDPALRNLGQVQQVAQAHCARYGRTAVQMPIGSLRGGQAPVMFNCKA